MKLIDKRSRKTGKPIEDVDYPKFRRNSVPLSKAFPEIAVQWDRKKNCGWGPEDFASGSGVVAYWKCEEGPDHEWKTTINARTTDGGRGCPFCANQLVSVTNNLAKLSPKIAKEFDTKRNGLSPSKVVAGSFQMAWWKCPNGPDHQWQNTPYARVNGEGCPFCSHHRLSVTNSFAKLRPKMARELHPGKNKITAQEVVAGSELKAWWQCKNNPKHQWQASFVSRYSAGSGCPYCNKGEGHDLTKFPGALKCLDREKNNDIDIKHVGSSRVIYWKCPEAKDHVWSSTFKRQKNDFCPFCRKKKASKKYNLKTEHPRIASEFHPTLNADIDPRTLRSKGSDYIWWQCRKIKTHVWQAEVYQRTALQTRCPYCTNVKIDKTNCLATLKPKLAKEWHPTKNGSLTPFNVGPGSNKKVWWVCSKSKKHIWRTAVQSRGVTGTGCPSCKNKIASDENNLKNSFPKVAKQWHPTKNRKLKPENVTAKSSKKVWWRCPKFKSHEWQTSVSSRTLQGSGCPYCANRLVCKENCLATICPKVAKEWHPSKNKDLTPKDVVAASARKIWFMCRLNKNHIWLARLQDRVTKGSGCPHCWREGFTLQKKRKRR